MIMAKRHRFKLPIFGRTVSLNQNFSREFITFQIKKRLHTLELSSNSYRNHPVNNIQEKNY